MNKRTLLASCTVDRQGTVELFQEFQASPIPFYVIVQNDPNGTRRDTVDGSLRMAKRVFCEIACNMISPGDSLEPDGAPCE
jgi:hypothetical protein